MNRTLIVTAPPYAAWLEKAAAAPGVSGVRINTVMPVAHELGPFVARLRSRVAPRDLWVDLKCRQLRVASASYVPYHHVELTHEIEVRTPVKALFAGGDAEATVSRVEGSRLWLEDAPPIPLGAGMSVNIVDPSLRVRGYLTPRDREYVGAARAAGVHTYLLSYVETSGDIEDLLALDGDAKILAKIESKKGLEWARSGYPRYADRVNLVAARGDLWLELGDPGAIVDALRGIIAADPGAVAASRIVSSIAKGAGPTCEEVCDVAFLAELGYRTLLLGDELSYREAALMRAIPVLEDLLRR